MISIDGLYIRIKGNDDIVATDLCCLLKHFQQQRPDLLTIAIMALEATKSKDLRYDQEA